MVSIRIRGLGRVGQRVVSQCQSLDLELGTLKKARGKVSLQSHFPVYSIPIYVVILSGELHCDVIGDFPNYPTNHSFSQGLLGAYYVPETVEERAFPPLL